MRSPVDNAGFRNPLGLVEERSTELRKIIQNNPSDFGDEFRQKLLLSWIYHDNALE